MSYQWDDFKHIRTFPSLTRVYRNGDLVPDLSMNDLDTTAPSDLPLHIIHIGKITDDQNWFIDMNDDRDVFLTARIEVDTAVRINIEINANVPGKSFDGMIFCKNTGKLMLNIIGNNNRADTRVICKTKLFAGPASENDLVGLANIPAETVGSVSDISFSALCDPNVRSIKMSPVQRISSVPLSAEHSASIWRPTPARIKYLETAGLSDGESVKLLNAAFLEEII